MPKDAEGKKGALMCESRCGKCALCLVGDLISTIKKKDRKLSGLLCLVAEVRDIGRELEYTPGMQLWADRILTITGRDGIQDAVVYGKPLWPSEVDKPTT